MNEPEPTPNLVALREYGLTGSIGADRTVLAGISRPPEPSAASAPHDVDVDTAGPLTEVAERLRARLELAVAERVDLGAPTAVHLSGGLDSSTITVLARRTGREVISATRAFPGWRCDERRYFELLLDSRSVVSDAARFEWEELVEFSTRTLTLAPFPEFMMTRDLMHRLVAEGCRVLLTGHGGDQLFAPLASSRLQLLATGSVRAAVTGLGRRPAVAVPNLWQAFAPAVADAVRTRTAPPEMARRARRLAYERARTTTELFQAACLDAGLTARYPFYDPAVVAWSLALPERTRLDRSGTRPLHRQLMAGLVPEPIRLRRTKADFTDAHRAAASWLALRRRLPEGRAVTHGLVDRATLVRLLDAAEGDATDGWWALPLWRVVQIEAFLEALAARPQPPAPKLSNPPPRPST